MCECYFLYIYSGVISTLDCFSGHFLQQVFAFWLFMQVYQCYWFYSKPKSWLNQTWLLQGPLSFSNLLPVQGLVPMSWAPYLDFYQLHLGGPAPAIGQVTNYLGICLARNKIDLSKLMGDRLRSPFASSECLCFGDKICDLKQGTLMSLETEHKKTVLLWRHVSHFFSQAL